MSRAAAAVLLLVALLSTGCQIKRYDFRGEHTGVVTGYDRTKTTRQIVVRSDRDGREYFYTANRATRQKCPVGARWPDCKTRKPQ